MVSTCVLTAALASLTSSANADDAKTHEVAVESIKLQVPESWKSEKPTSSLRKAQFAIPAVEGDKEGAELAIFPPLGGTPEANIVRWIGQFEADGREVKMTKGESEQGTYIFVDATGTYKKPVGPPIAQKTTPMAGYRMYGVIFTAKEGGNYFFKLTGPDKTVEAQKDALRTSFGGKAADEQEYKLEK
jgi:gluconolactonase